MTNVNGVSTLDLSAVVLNVTVTDPGSAGFVTAYASGTPPPSTSNLNYAVGQTVPNLVIAPVSADGGVVLHNTSAGSVHSVVDVSGYFSGSPSSGWTPARGRQSSSGIARCGVVSLVDVLRCRRRERKLADHFQRHVVDELGQRSSRQFSTYRAHQARSASLPRPMASQLLTGRRGRLAHHPMNRVPSQPSRAPSRRGA